MRKSNTVQNLFSQLQKILEIMSEKELTTFQEQLYKNLLNSALDAREEGKNSKPTGEPVHIKYETTVQDTTTKD